MEQIGIHCAKEGYHTKVAEIDSPFGQLMREWGIEPPGEDIRILEFDKHWFKDEKNKGKSTLTKYSCPDCGMSVRYTRKDDPLLMHIPCGSVLVREGDRVDQTVYQRPELPPEEEEARARALDNFLKYAFDDTGLDIGFGESGGPLS